jgi:hypothetical protein
MSVEPKLGFAYILGAEKPSTPTGLPQHTGPPLS